MPKGRPRPFDDKRRADEVDCYVGSRIHERRVLLGLTQKQLGELLGVSYQQVHRYETGMNRVTVGRLFQVAQVFHVDVAYFYQNTDGMTKQHRLIQKLTRNFTAIPSSIHRQALSALARFMASIGDGV